MQGGPLESQYFPDDSIELAQQKDEPPGLDEQLEPPQVPHALSQHAFPSECLIPWLQLGSDVV